MDWEKYDREDWKEGDSFLAYWFIPPITRGIDHLCIGPDGGIWGDDGPVSDRLQILATCKIDWPERGKFLPKGERRE